MQSSHKETISQPSLPFLLALFCLSASVLAYEFYLMRLLALMVWTPFVHLIISMAMLGFGVSGTLLWILRRTVQNLKSSFIFFTSFLFLITATVCLIVSQSVKFNAFMMLWDIGEYFNFLLLVLVFFLPFLIGAAGIGGFFMLAGKSAGRVYFFNLIGSAAGIAILAFSMNHLSPQELGLVVIVTSLLCLLSLICDKTDRKFALQRRSFLVTGMVIGVIFLFAMRIQLSEYKAFNMITQTPGAEVICEEYSPMGWLQAVKSPSFHHMPGISLNYTRYPPEQIALFLDGDLLGSVDKHDVDDLPGDYMSYTPQELPYTILSRPEVMVIGARGGSEVFHALSHDVKQIDVIEVCGDVKSIVDSKLFNFSGEPYAQPGVNFISANPRSWLNSHRSSYNLILYPAAGSSASTVAGMSALHENYLFTKEALVDALHCVKPGGLIYLGAWIRYPPKEGIKLISLAVESLEKYGVSDPAKHLFAYRSWNICSLLISPSPLDASFHDKAVEFLESKSFDAVYFDGITSDHVNKLNFIEDAPYYSAAKSILSPGREEYYVQSLFNVRPSSDDKPFFANFLKWSSIPWLYKTMQTDWIPFMDLGQLLTIAALVHALVIGFILIFLPLTLSRLSAAGEKIRSRGLMVIYFSSIGFGFFLLEMGFIQRFSLVMIHPVISSFFVVTVFLVGAGAGSMYFHKSREVIGNKPWRFFSLILILLVFYSLALQGILHYTLQFTSLVNIIVAIAVILPLAFFMGMAFPYGLVKLSKGSAEQIPWAWGINAYSSLLAGIMAPLIAQTGGFIVMMLLAGVFYICAAMVSRRL